MYGDVTVNEIEYHLLSTSMYVGATVNEAEYYILLTLMHADIVCKLLYKIYFYVGHISGLTWCKFIHV